MQKNKKILALTTVILLLTSVAIAAIVLNSGFLATNNNEEPSPLPSPTPEASPTESPSPEPTIAPTATPIPAHNHNEGLTPTTAPKVTATPIPSPSPLPTANPHENELFRDNFESGDMSAWTNTDRGGIELSVENHMLKCSAPWATNESWGYLYKWLDQNYTSIYWRWYVFFDNLPTTDGNIIGAGGIYNSAVEQQFSPANSVCSLSIVREDGVCVWKLTYTNSSSLNSITGTQSVQADTWYLVELKAIEGNGTGEVHFYLNNVEALNATGLVNNDNAGIDHVSIGGGITADQPVTWYCGGAVAATEYIGPEPTTAAITQAATAPAIPLALCVFVAGSASTLFLTKTQIARRLKK